MQTNLDAFITADDGFNASRSSANAASALYQAALDAVYVWLLAARNVLVPKFGTRWSTAWAQAGFINPSTAVPRRLEDRLALALSLQAFFDANPTYEVPSLNVTSAEARIRRNAALTTQSSWDDAEMALKTAGETRNTAYETLVAGMRALISNLQRKLGPLDPRWLAFGLNQPGMNQTPGQPVNVSAYADATGTIVVQCDPVPLATRYRWRMLLVGVETDYRLVARSVDPVGMIKGVQPGATARIIVQAVNVDLQGVASAPIEFTMPLGNTIPASETVALAAPAMDAPAGAANGQGTNGHASRRRTPALT
jgi:hypothetical protein